MVSAVLMPPRMAKKHASELRREDQTPNDFREAARQLKEQAGFLEELAGQIEKAGVKRMEVDGVKKMPNGLQLVRTYVGNVQKAFIDHQNKQGRR